MTELHELSIAAVKTRFLSRSLKPSDYLAALLARLAAYDDAIHSMIAIDSARAKADAVEADAAYAAGAPRGPLDGIPVAIKDVIDVAGLPTTCYSRLLLDNVAACDAVMVATLRRAGAIILGKSATHEFAIGGPAFDLPFPPARNAWNIAHHPGGSSSGSGAGVAAGFFPAAIGTDTGGSVRHPASASGVVGLKPTYDAISRSGVFPLAFSLDHVGSLARTVADAALLCDVMAEGRTAATHQIGQPIRGVKVGYVKHFHTADMIADAEVSEALDVAARRLADLGAQVSEITLPSLLAFASVNRIILQSEAIAVHGKWLRETPEAYCRLSRRGILPGIFLSAEDLIQAQRCRRQLIDAVESAFSDVDVLLTASSMETACRIDDEAEIARTYGRQARTPFNVTGHPAIALRSGMSRAGLPLSLQIAGRYHDEALICRVAAAIELPSAIPPLDTTQFATA
jgi:aspartyl-tRNA(Asn)/glutamyl-tRNA(Gln) amidotransferase subunit A